MSFSSNFFNLSSRAFLRELDVLPGFIISRHNIEIITYADETLLMADRQRENAVTPTKATKEKEEEWTKHKFSVYGCQQKEQSRVRAVNWRSQKQTSTQKETPTRCYFYI